MSDTQSPKVTSEPKAPKADVPEAVFTRPTSQLDLEARQKEAARVAKEGVVPLVTSVNPAAPDDSGFIATDPIYQNRANETDMPVESEEGPDAQVEEDYIKSFDKPDHEAAARKKAAADKKTEEKS